MEKKIALKNGEEFVDAPSNLDMLDRIWPSLVQRDNIRKWQKVMDPDKPAFDEDEFEEGDIPEGDVTQAEEMSVPISDIEEFAEETGEEAELEDTKRVMKEYDERDDVLPIEDVKVLAEAFAEDYGYLGIEGEYIPPAGAQKRSEAKAILIRLYDKLPKSIVRNKEKTLQYEFMEIDGLNKNYKDGEPKPPEEQRPLNDLEIRHVISYYKKLLNKYNKETKETTDTIDEE